MIEKVLDHSTQAARREARWERDRQAIFKKWGHLDGVPDDLWRPFLDGLVMPDRMAALAKAGPAHIYVSGQPADEMADIVRELHRRNLDLRLIGLALAWGRHIQHSEPEFRGSKWRLRQARAERGQVDLFLKSLPYLRRLAEPGGLLSGKRSAVAAVLRAVWEGRRWANRVLKAHQDLGKVRAPKDAFARGGPVDRALRSLGVPDYRDSYHEPPPPRLRPRLLKWQRDRLPSGIGGLDFYKPRRGAPDIFPDYFWALIPRHRRRLLKEGRSVAQLDFPQEPERARRRPGKNPT